MNYTKTTWENDITPVSAENMNKIEQLIQGLSLEDMLAIDDYILEKKLLTK